MSLPVSVTARIRPSSITPATLLLEIISVRKTPGGPAPSETARALAASRTLLESDVAWLDAARDKLKRADGRLTEAARAL